MNCQAYTYDRSFVMYYFLGPRCIKRIVNTVVILLDSTVGLIVLSLLFLLHQTLHIVSFANDCAKLRSVAEKSVNGNCIVNNI